MIFKSYLLEKNLEPLNNIQLNLFYGENQGLKNEFKKKLKKKYASEEILNLFQEDIIKNKNILINEVLNRSLFDQAKIIFVNEANDKILDILEEILENIQDDKIFLFADVLDKKSKLRNFFEKSKNLSITPCYQDNLITVRNIIITKLNSFQGVNNQVINLIIQSTGLNRNKIENEITKIESFFIDKKIKYDSLEILLNIKVNEDFNMLKDMAMSGNKTETNRLLADTVIESENNVYYLNLINQRLNTLHQIEALKTENNIETLVDNLKPPVFWKDKPTLIMQSKKWDKEKILSALNKTYEAEIEIKTKSSMRKDLIIKNLMVTICSKINAS